MISIEQAKLFPKFVMKKGILSITEFTKNHEGMSNPQYIVVEKMGTKSEKGAKRERKYRYAITQKTLEYLHDKFSISNMICFDEAFLDVNDFALMKEGTFLKFIEVNDRSVRWNLKEKVRTISGESCLQYSVIQDPNEIVSLLQRKEFSIKPSVYNPLGNPLDYCTPFVSFRVARWLFTTPMTTDLEFMIDLALLDEKTYHLVATIRVKEPIQPQAQQILDNLKNEDGFLIHPVESRLSAWLRKHNRFHFPDHSISEGLTLFNECPFENVDVPTEAFYETNDF
jgi:hypothetical protein